MLFINIITRYFSWDISNVYDISHLFANCSSLEILPDISNWNTKNINLMDAVFYKCSSLKSLPNISNWNLSNVDYISCLFYGCSSLISLPDISEWNMDNIITLNLLFFNCSSLIELPDISKWNIFTSNLNKFFSKISFNNILSQLKKSSFFLMENYGDIYLGPFDIQCKIPEIVENLKEKIIKRAYSLNSLFAGCSSLKKYLIFQNGI